MLINLLPDFFAVLDSTDRQAAYQRYFNSHRKILEPYWHNYVIDPDGPHYVDIVRSTVAAARPDLRAMLERTDVSLAARKIALGLAGTFGVVAVLLAALGVYGVLAHLVAQRRREIGIRVALGSSARAVFRLVLGEGLWLTVTGLVVGMVGAIAVARSLADQVFGIAPTDPVVLGGVVLATGAIALLACVLPAVRATRVDPIVVLTEP